MGVFDCARYARVTGMFGIDTTGDSRGAGSRAPQRVPLAPAYIAGVMPYRGEVLTTVSLRALLGMEDGSGRARCWCWKTRRRRAVRADGGWGGRRDDGRSRDGWRRIRARWTRAARRCSTVRTGCRAGLMVRLDTAAAAIAAGGEAGYSECEEEEKERDESADRGRFEFIRQYLRQLLQRIGVDVRGGARWAGGAVGFEPEAFD